MRRHNYVNQILWKGVRMGTFFCKVRVERGSGRADCVEKQKKTVFMHQVLIVFFLTFYLINLNILSVPNVTFPLKIFKKCIFYSMIQWKCSISLSEIGANSCIQHFHMLCLFSGVMFLLISRLVGHLCFVFSRKSTKQMFLRSK